jgi:hypothetical protein
MAFFPASSLQLIYAYQQTSLMFAQWDESGSRGLRGGRANWAKNGAPYILVYTAVISLKEHLKIFMVDIYLRNNFI